MRKAQLQNSVKCASSVNKGNGKRNGGSNGKAKQNGKGDGKVLLKFVDGKLVEGRYYSSKEFGEMTSKQRTAIIEMRRQSKGSGNHPKNVS